MSNASITARWKESAPHLQALLRIVAAYVFITAGTMKLFAWPMGMPPDGSTAHIWTEVWFAGILETFGGSLMLLGLCVRPVAFILSGEMAVAYWQFQAGATPAFPTMNNGVAAVMYCFVWLYFSAAGAGPWSLDSKMRKVR
jgi:putative oxidoreductase